MKMLLVEDDENKWKQLISFLKDNFPLFEIDLRKSYHSGLSAVLTNTYKLILLDMTMPNYDISADEDGGRPQHFAGREILWQMKRRNIKTPVIIVTQFDEFGEKGKKMTLNELQIELQEDHKGVYQGVVYYNVAIDEWKIKLKNMLTSLLAEVRQ